MQNWYSWKMNWKLKKTTDQTCNFPLIARSYTQLWSKCAMRDVIEKSLECSLIHPWNTLHCKHPKIWYMLPLGKYVIKSVQNFTYQTHILDLEQNSRNEQLVNSQWRKQKSNLLPSMSVLLAISLLPSGVSSFQPFSEFRILDIFLVVKEP